MITPLADLQDPDGIFPRCHYLLVCRFLFACCSVLGFGGERAQPFEVNFTQNSWKQGGFLFQGDVTALFCWSSSRTLQLCPEALELSPCPDSCIFD